MSSHYCTGIIRKHGQHWWGCPEDGPSADPIPDWILERHPDILTFWENCPDCREPICGRPARFEIELCGVDGIEKVWLCADHYDDFIADHVLPNWHQCFGSED